jgi:hypothetical protein
MEEHSEGKREKIRINKHEVLCKGSLYKILIIFTEEENIETTITYFMPG